MRARQLIADSSYGPETLKVLFQAFDEAWKVVEPLTSQDEMAVEAARLKLASIVLTVATRESRDAEQIKNAALILMNIGRKVAQKR
jgi:hypothetical protein